MVDTSSEPVRVEQAGKTALVVLQRPLRRNAMDQGLVDGVREALVEMSHRDDVKAIVLQGSAPGFCAGSDLKFIGDMNIDAVSRFEQECGDLGRLIGFVDKPVIAAVEGFAIGGGVTLATCCDFVVTSREAKWSLPEVPIGWLTPWGINSLVQRLGYVGARQFCYGLGDYTGTEAKEMGLADYAVAAGTAAESALELAGRIGELPSVAVATTKRFFSSYIMREAEGMDYEANRLFCENFREPAAQATLARFRGSGKTKSGNVKV